MKKSDLKYGNVVEVRNGQKYVVCHNGCEKALVSLLNGWGTDIDFYNENLTYDYSIRGFDIMKVYKDYTCKELLWERKEAPKLTEDEKTILRNVPQYYKWIARDKCGTICVFIYKPPKSGLGWGGHFFETLVLFDHLFQFIKWEDEEPYSIEELLGEEK